MTPLEVNKKIAEIKGYKIKEILGATLLCVCPYREDPNSFYESCQTRWDYSMNEAWELFKEMPESFSIQKDGLQWMVWKRKTNGTIRFIDSVDTAPMAICLAWLAWKENK